MDENSVLMMWNHEQMYDKLIRLMENAETEILAFLSAYVLTITTDEASLQIPKRRARERGVKLRYITEITAENLSYCKRQLDLVDELRHIGGVKGNFLMSESEFVASDEIAPQFPITQGFYSNVKKIVKLEGYLFETFWEYAIPATDRIKALEGATTHFPPITERARKVIDRFYVCEQCRSIFIYAEDAKEHKQSTGHAKTKEFPFFESK
jgi:hypothetical protein